jgi:hypothetical protein
VEVSLSGEKNQGDDSILQCIPETPAARPAAQTIFFHQLECHWAWKLGLMGDQKKCNSGLNGCDGNKTYRKNTSKDRVEATQASTIEKIR